MGKPIFIRRRGYQRPAFARWAAWSSVKFRDGFCLGVLAGVVGCAVFVNIVMRIWG